MLKTILVPIGDTVRSENAIHQAVALARAFSSRTSLLGIVRYSDRDSAHQFIDPVSWNTAKSRKHAALSELAARLEARKLPIDLDMLDISTSERFIRYVQDGGFDLILFSEDDQTPRALIRDALAYTTVPVYMARSRSLSLHPRILLPLDGSQRAECMLPLATTMAQTLGATLLLTHIIKEPEMARRTSPNAEDTRLVAQLIERNRQDSTQYLNDLSARLSVPTEVHLVTHRSISTALHDLIKQQNVDLVMLCAHGYSGKPDQPFGSITSNLIDYCATSLIVIQDLPSNLPAIEAEAAGRPAWSR